MAECLFRISSSSFLRLFAIRSAFSFSSFSWCSADSEYNSALLSTNVIVTHDGNLTWLSSAIFKSSCGRIFSQFNRNQPHSPLHRLFSAFGASIDVVSCWFSPQASMLNISHSTSRNAPWNSPVGPTTACKSVSYSFQKMFDLPIPISQFEMMKFSFRWICWIKPKKATCPIMFQMVYSLKYTSV